MPTKKKKKKKKTKEIEKGIIIKENGRKINIKFMLPT